MNVAKNGMEVIEVAEAVAELAGFGMKAAWKFAMLLCRKRDISVGCFIISRQLYFPLISSVLKPYFYALSKKDSILDR